MCMCMCKLGPLAGPHGEACALKLHEMDAAGAEARRADERLPSDAPCGQPPQLVERGVVSLPRRGQLETKRLQTQREGASLRLRQDSTATHASCESRAL